MVRLGMQIQLQILHVLTTIRESAAAKGLREIEFEFGKIAFELPVHPVLEVFYNQAG